MISRAAALIKQTFSEWQEDNVARLAAALAYYTTFSLAPLLVLVIAIAGLLGGRDAAQNQAMLQVEDLLGTDGREFVQGMIQSASQQTTGVTATIVGAVTLLFGALGAFGELQTALNTIWDVRPLPAKNALEGIKRFVMRRVLSFTLVLGVGFLLLASLVISAILSAVTEIFGNALPFSGVAFETLNFLISVVVITLLFAMIFKVLPDVEVAWRDVWLGALLTSLLFNFGKILIGFYLGRSEVGSSFGAAGSLALMMVWIYYSAQILFLGAEFTQVYANRYGSMIRPDEGMELIDQQKFEKIKTPRKYETLREP